jgi:ATP-dependent helicase Lhr and Lhr-like helicase
VTSTFSRFPPRLQQAIVSRVGWSSLRPVQELSGAALLDGKNAVILAPTAGGKTEASIFPALAQLMEDPPEAVGALYLAPIKALLNNQASGSVSTPRWWACGASSGTATRPCTSAPRS